VVRVEATKLIARSLRTQQRANTHPEPTDRPDPTPTTHPPQGGTDGAGVLGPAHRSGEPHSRRSTHEHHPQRVRPGRGPHHPNPSHTP
jgi:hypothetical protein